MCMCESMVPSGRGLESRVTFWDLAPSDCMLTDGKTLRIELLVKLRWERWHAPLRSTRAISGKAGKEVMMRPKVLIWLSDGDVGTITRSQLAVHRILIMSCAAGESRKQGMYTITTSAIRG